MTVATEITTPVAPVAQNGTAAPSTPPTAQAPAGTTTAPEKPAPAQPAEVIDWKARHDKLTTESIPKLQSERSTAITERDALKTKVADLEAQLSERGSDDDLEYTVAHERDLAYLNFLEDVASKGFTIRQVLEKLRSDIRNAEGNRADFETKRQSVDGLIKTIEGYDPDYARFLKDMDKNGVTINHDSIGSLRSTYDRLTAKGATPAQAATAAAAAAAPTPETPKEPPTVAPAGGADKIAGTPVWKPGMRARDVVKAAIASPWGSDFTRKARG